MSLSLSPLLIVAVLALAGSLLPQRGSRRLAAVGLLFLALSAAATVIAPGDGPLATLTARATMAGVPRETLLVDVALAAVGMLSLLAAGFRVLRSGADREATLARPLPVSSAIILSTIAVLVAPTLWLLVLASMAAAVATAASGRRRWLLATAVAVTTGAVAWFACTVGETWDVRLTRLDEVPLSDAAQRVVAAPLLLAVGLWLAGAFTAAASHRAASWIGVLLAARIGTVLAPAGIEGLAPVLWPLTAAVVGLAAWQRRGAAAALAALTLAACTAASTEIGLALTAAALLLAWTDAYDWPSRVRRAAWALASVVAVLALPGMLRGQVVWTLGVLVMLGIAAWRSGGAAPAKA